MGIHSQTLNQTEEPKMIRKKPLRPETVEALQERLGGKDGAKVSVDPNTGSITIKDGEIKVALSVPDILRKQEGESTPPETKS